MSPQIHRRHGYGYVCAVEQVAACFYFWEDTLWWNMCVYKYYLMKCDLFVNHWAMVQRVYMRGVSSVMCIVCGV